MKFTLGILTMVGAFVMINGIANGDDSVKLSGFLVGVTSFMLWYFLYASKDDGINGS